MKIFQNTQQYMIPINVWPRIFLGTTTSLTGWHCYVIQDSNIPTSERKPNYMNMTTTLVCKFMTVSECVQMMPYRDSIIRNY